MFLIYGIHPAFFATHRKEECIDILEESLSSPMQVEILARKLAWQTVFQEVEIIEGEGPKKYFSFFKETFAKCHLAANLLLSDAADYGTQPVKNAFACRKRKIRSVLDLQGAFQNIPAIIAGAGPSLPSLKNYEESALIFAGGAALDRIDVKPHFAASIDKEGPLKKIPSPDIAFCFQSRLNEAVLSKIKGPLLRAPESHFEFLRWIEGEERGFDGGWTVGNFLVSLAAMYGCNPIILVGMDFCYKEGKKYAQDAETSSSEGLVYTVNRKKEKVLTQKDWLMASHWMSECAKRYPDRQFIDGCGEGIDFGSSIAVKKIESLHLKQQKTDLREVVHRIVQQLPTQKKSEKRWKQWREELKRNGPLVQQKLLEPLWQIWEPIFAREVRQEKELEIHRMIFSDRVRSEHLHVLD